MGKQEIVEIWLAIGDDGGIDRDGPFLVIAEDDDRCGSYVNEPDVIVQLAPDEDTARFEATWDGQWRFGKRLHDA